MTSPCHVFDRRIGSTDSMAHRATYLLRELADRAALAHLGWGVWGEHYRRMQPKKPPGSYATRPGAFVEKLPAEQRAILRHLESSHTASPSDWLTRMVFREGGRHWPLGGVLVVSPTTIWKVGKP